MRVQPSDPAADTQLIESAAEHITSETPGTSSNPTVSLAWSAAPALLTRINTALGDEQAKTTAAAVIADAEHEADKIRMEAMVLLQEAEAERVQAARLRAHTEAEQAVAHQLVEDALAEAQASLDAATAEAEAIGHGARLKARLMLAAAASEARIMHDDAGGFTWTT